MSGAAPKLQIVEERAVDPATGATAAAVDPTQRIVAVGYATGAVRLFVAGDPASIEIRAGGASPVQHLVFVPGEPALAAIDDQGVLRVLDTDTLQMCFEFTIPVRPTCTGLIPGTSWLLVGTDVGRVYFVDVVEGRKADFSIGCLTSPASPVAAVEAHPVEAEKIMVAYASGECVVSDLGRASGSEKSMVLNRHRLEQSPGIGLVVSQLIAACWSPAGDRLAAVYSNGTLCVFGTAAGAAPIATATVSSPSVSASDGGPRTIRNLRWCTHAEHDCSFLVVTSQTMGGAGPQLHMYGTRGRDAGVKSSRDISHGESRALDSPLLAICAVPRTSPWRGGNDEVRFLAALTGQPGRVQLLDILPNMSLRPSSELPDELEWCRVAPRIVHRASSELNTALSRFLAGTFRRGQPVPAAGAGAAAESQAITQLYCCVDDADVLSVWCVASGRLQRCHGLGLDLRRLARLAGIEGEVSSVSLCAQIGLLAVGMAGGEVLLALLTGDPWSALAQRYTPLNELRMQAATYYSSDATGGQAARRAPAPGPRRNVGSQSAQDAPADAAVADGANARAVRPTSLHEAGIFRRSSRRISASFGTMFGRGSTASDPSAQRLPQRRDTAAAVHGSRPRPRRKALVSSGAEIGAGLARPAEVVASDWSAQLGPLCAELSRMLFGMRFNMDEQQRIFGSVQPEDRRTPKPDAGAAHRIESSPRPFVLPFMLARFVSRPLTSLVTSRDGLVAIAHAYGALVVIDGIHQCAVLADNINMAPAASSSVADLFGDGHAQPAATVTAAAFSLPLDPQQPGAASGRSASQSTLLVGTSRGHVIEYAVRDETLPPRIIARPSADPIVYLWSDDDGSLGREYASTAPGGGVGSSRRTFLAASTSMVALYAGPGSDPTAAYVVPDADGQLVAVCVVTLGRNWRGVAAVDSKARVALLSLPDLRRAALLPLPGNVDASFIASADVHIGEDGDIVVLGPHGRLHQARIASGAGEAAGLATGRPRFDPSLQPPNRPARKGITSWLLGKAADPSRDIDQLLASHHRDLLRGNGTRPGARLRKQRMSPDAENADMPACSHKRHDSKVDEINQTLAAASLGDAREMLNMRGQQLEEIGEASHNLRRQTQGFLDGVRDYNAKQKRHSKRRLGLF
ncbi:Lethal(2) giant larvae sro7 [Coemansia spiralis]|nr:Lethal(2) giant larvae sro7 [Coemansia spiralis]